MAARWELDRNRFGAQSEPEPNRAQSPTDSKPNRNRSPTGLKAQRTRSPIGTGAQPGSKPNGLEAQPDAEPNRNPTGLKAQRTRSPTGTQSDSKPNSFPDPGKEWRIGPLVLLFKRTRVAGPRSDLRRSLNNGQRRGFWVYYRSSGYVRSRPRLVAKRIITVIRSLTRIKSALLRLGSPDSACGKIDEKDGGCGPLPARKRFSARWKWCRSPRSGRCR